MKKRLLQLTVVLSANIFLLCLFSVATAGTIGNPTARVEQGVFQVGGEIDFGERDIDVDNSKDLEVESNRYIVTGAYGVSDQINVYAKLGMADASIDEHGIDFDGDMQITYGGGLRATVHEIDDVKIGVAAQISYFSSEDTEELQYYYYTYSTDIEVTWWEYEIAAGASYEGIESFVPYGGILFSKTDGEVKATQTSAVYSKSEKVDFDEADLVGIFLGADYNVTPEFKVGLEARLMNQTSFSLMANYVF